MAGFLVKTPYVLLLTVSGINVVSAARLAGEAGPIEHYASASAINGRAGLYPSRYQSDEVDRAGGALVRQCNRQLRGAAMLVAENLIKCHAYYRGLSALWAQHKVDRATVVAESPTARCGWFINSSAGGKCGAVEASNVNTCWPSCRNFIVFTIPRSANRSTT